MGQFTKNDWKALVEKETRGKSEELSESVHHLELRASELKMQKEIQMGHVPILLSIISAYYKSRLVPNKKYSTD